MKQKGFTLIELLVVIAIIGLLSTLAVVALNSARQRARDAKRVADIRQIQTALELGYSETSAYPAITASPNTIVLGTAGASLVLCKDATTGSATLGKSIWAATSGTCGTSGTVYMGLVPNAPTPGPATGNDYTYKSADGSTYSLTFSLEGATGQLLAGPNCANPNGIQKDTGSGC
jgi:general secretion pathway protein G